MVGAPVGYQTEFNVLASTCDERDPRLAAGPQCAGRERNAPWSTRDPDGSASAPADPGEQRCSSRGPPAARAHREVSSLPGAGVRLGKSRVLGEGMTDVTEPSGFGQAVLAVDRGAKP
jgi:hypothetical protein